MNAFIDVSFVNMTRAEFLVVTYPALHAHHFRKLVENITNVPDRQLDLHESGRVLVHASVPVVAYGVQGGWAGFFQTAAILNKLVFTARHLLDEHGLGLVGFADEVPSGLEEQVKHGDKHEAHHRHVHNELDPPGKDGRGARVVAEHREEFTEPSPPPPNCSPFCSLLPVAV